MGSSYEVVFMGCPLLFAGVGLQDHRIATVDQPESAAAALPDLGEVRAGVPAVQQRDAGHPATNLFIHG